MPSQRLERSYGKARGGGEDDVAGKPGSRARIVKDLRDRLAYLRRDRSMAAQHQVETLLAHEAVELHRAEPAEIDIEDEARALIGGRTACLPTAEIKSYRPHHAAIEERQHENAPITARGLCQLPQLR